MGGILSIALGGCLSLAGVAFGTWFTAHRQDRLWMREQKLKAAIEFTAAAGLLYDQHRGMAPEEVPSQADLTTRMQNGRSALYLLCCEETIELAEALARRILHTPIGDGQHTDTIALLRKFTRAMRRDIEA